MAGGRRHGLIDPKRRPFKSTEENAKKRKKREAANEEIIKKMRAQLEKEAQ